MPARAPSTTLIAATFGGEGHVEPMEWQGTRSLTVPPSAADAARSQRRLRLLAQVAGLVEAPLDLQATLQQVADLAIHELADWCAVDLEPHAEPDGPDEAGEAGTTAARRPKLVAVAHTDPAMVELALELQQRYPPPEHDPERERLLRDLTPIHVPVVSDEMLVASAQDDEHLDILRSLGMTSAVAVPLQASGRGFGVMLLVATGGRHLDTDDVELAVELGRRAGAAVDKARLASRLARTAAELTLSEERYRTLVQASSMAVWRAGPDGTTLTEMPAWQQITGSERTSGWAWIDDVHPAERERVRQNWLASVATGERYEQTYRIRDRAGGWRWVTARAVPLREDREDPESAVLEWIGSVDDVTAETLARTRSQALLASAQSLARAVDVTAVLVSLRDVAAASLDAASVVVVLPPRPVGALDAGAGTSAELPPGDGTRELRLVTSPREIQQLPGLADVVAGGDPVFVNAPDESEDTEAGEAASAVVPMTYDGRVVAAVRFGWHEPQGFDTAARWTLLAIGAQYAAALMRARLYEAERATSLMLQSALAPVVPRRVACVRIGVHYRPAGIHVQVGGDWADAFSLPDGRVLIAVGDVMGSGIAAAATMGRLRTALAALALHQDDPAWLLADLDRFLGDALGDPLATLGVAVLDADGRAADFYSAGHLPALVAPPDGGAHLVLTDQVPPLGVGWSRDGTLPRATRLQLTPGSVVALCTDGLLETRNSQIDERLDAWRQLVDAALPLPDDLDAAAAALVERIAPSADDDVTLLLARAQPRCPSGR